MAQLTHEEILAWLRETDPARLEQLFVRADKVRRQNVGDEVHLRGLIEISSYCVRQCHYCGLRAAHAVPRYRSDKLALFLRYFALNRVIRSMKKRGNHSPRFP